MAAFFIYDVPFVFEPGGLRRRGGGLIRDKTLGGGGLKFTKLTSSLL